MLKRLAPWLFIGPITGPLAEGIYRNWRKSETMLAFLYALAFAIVWFDLAIAFRTFVQI